MKKTIIGLFALLFAVSSQAQTEQQKSTVSADGQSAATEVTTASKPAHIDFMGIPIDGNIDNFTKQLQPRYKLKKKMGGDRYYIFEGSIYGYNTYFEVSYTRKTRTVYKVMLTPKAINTMAWTDSLTAHYGEPVETQMGTVWQHPAGMILMRAPEGYDPAFIYLDYAGNAAFKEEK